MAMVDAGGVTYMDVIEAVSEPEPLLSSPPPPPRQPEMERVNNEMSRNVMKVPKVLFSMV